MPRVTQTDAQERRNDQDEGPDPSVLVALDDVRVDL